MIHTLLQLTRPLFVLDTETTGVDVQKDRICELGFEMWIPEGLCLSCKGRTRDNIQIESIKALCPEEPCSICGGTGKMGGLVKEWRSLINPGIPMPAGAEAVHHISDDDLRSCQLCQELPGHRDHVTTNNSKCHPFHPWPTFKQLALSLASGFHDCDYAGKNVRFDLRILANEMTRNGQPWSYAGARIVDAERLEQLAVPRDLGSLHEKYTGRKHDGAHGALSDVRASTTVICKQLELHTQLPRDMDALHTLQWPDWLCADGSFRLVNGVATCMFGKHKNTPVNEVPVSYWDWLLGQRFPEDVVQIVKDAKMGKYK